MAIFYPSFKLQLYVVVLRLVVLDHVEFQFEPRLLQIGS